jgi:hypothetical protein
MIEDRDPNYGTSIGSERSFGVVFALVFFVVGLWPLIFDHQPRMWALVVGLVFLCLGFFLPQSLRRLNVVWFRFGILLGRVVSPVVLGIIFCITVVPIGLLMRLLGKDLLKLRMDHNVASYWIKKETDVSSMSDQF